MYISVMGRSWRYKLLFSTNVFTELVCASGSRPKGHIISLEWHKFPGKKGSGYEKCQGIFDSKGTT